MPEVTVVTPYASAIPFINKALPGWLDEYNAQRLAAYDLYDDMFKNSPSTVQLMLRGTDEKPIYVPTAKRIVNTLARYIGRKWGYAISPLDGTAEEQAAATEAFGTLFKRERILSQFSTGKKEWLRRGDWVWYLQADATKVAGSRITVRTIDPRTYFPITSETEPDRLTGAALIEEYVLDDGKTMAIKQQRWLKASHPEHPNFGQTPAPDAPFEVAYESTIFDLANWQDPTKRKILKELEPLGLLTGITAVPLYHIKNNPESGDPFGASEFSGLESLIAGINQAISDEDLALAMAGLGMYETDSGAPVDPVTKQPTNWQLGPQMVVEHGVGTSFNRISGITSVQPTQDHVKYLENQVYGTSGINNIALGSASVDTHMSQLSGIALAIHMQPLFDAADDKDLQINDILTQMFYDLQTMWFPTYEPETPTFVDCVITSASDQGSRLPFDRAERWKELTDGYAAGIFPLEFVHKVLVDEFGYELDKNDLQAALDQQAAKAAQADPYGARVAAELGTGASTDAGAADASTATQ